MKVTIIQDDGIVGIDGEFRPVDLSDLDERIHAIQYNSVSGVGHIEFDADLDPRLPNQPLGKAKFDKLFGRYVKRWRAAGEPPPMTLEEARESKRQQINSKRDNLEQGGFPYLDKIIDSNPVSVQRMSVAALTAQMALATGQPYIIRWTTQDNSIIELDAHGVLGMPVALAVYGNELHEIAKTLKEQLDAATTIEEIKAVPVWIEEGDG